MKRTPVILLLVVGLCFGMVSCGGSSKKAKSSQVSRGTPSYFKDQNSYFYFLVSRLKESDQDLDEVKKYLLMAQEQDKDSSELWTERAYIEAQEGKFDVSKASAERALELNPKNPDTLFLLGKMASFEKDSVTAIRYYRRALRYDAESEEIYHLMAREYYTMDDQRQAIRTLDTCLDKIPDSISCMYYLGSIHMELGQDALAVKYLSMVVELYPEQTKVLQTLADIHVKNENYEEALEVYQKLFRLNPDDMGVQIRIGGLYHKMGQVAFAIEIFEKIRERFPNADRVNFFLGLMYFERKEWVSALDAFSRIRGESTYFQKAVGQQIAILREQNRLDEVAFVLEPHLKEVGDPWLHQFLGWFLTNRDLDDQAVTYLSRGIKRFGSDEDLLFQRAIAYEKMDRWKDSKKDLQTIIDNHPKSSKAYNFLGYTMAVRGEDLDEALKLVEKANELDANQGHILDSLGWIYFKMGNLPKALDYLKQAQKLENDEPTILEHLGDVYLAMKDKRSARNYYEQALRLLNAVEEKQSQQKRQIEEIETKLGEF